MKVVIDTNVLLSGIISHEGSPQQIVYLVLTGKINAYTTLHLWNEFNRILSYPRIKSLLEKKNLLEEVQDLLVKLQLILHRVDKVSPLKSWIPDDTDDDWVVQCAITAQADYIISGDRHLTSLGGIVEGIPIVTPRQFMDECWGK